MQARPYLRTVAAQAPGRGGVAMAIRRAVFLWCFLVLLGPRVILHLRGPSFALRDAGSVGSHPLAPSPLDPWPCGMQTSGSLHPRILT
jgi:hypothetical protein